MLEIEKPAAEALQMSLKRNIVANYIGQFYTTAIAIVMTPVYVKYMGAEAYGLVGFYAMLQSLFTLLDMGLTPLMARETARFNGGAIDGLSLRQLLRALEGVFIGVGALGAATMIAGAQRIATGWLNVQHLSAQEVQHSIMLMAGIIVLRWVCGLYRGVITGFEQLVWLNSFNVAIATSRFVLVVPLFIYIGSAPTYFFAFQFVIALIEITVLVAKTYRLMPKIEAGTAITWQWQPIRAGLNFSLAIAFTSSVWVLVTQTDKFLLSKLLTLSDYGYFTLAVLAASGVMLIGGPISGALLPRLTKLNAAGDEEGLIRLYRNATQLVALIVVPTALVMATFADQVLWVWTGDKSIAQNAAPVLALYALGNGFLALGAFPYYLQYAKGDLKLHLIGNLLFVLLLIPGMVLATTRYGVTGAGYTWLAANITYFVLWTPLVHRRFLKSLHSKWLIYDIGYIAIPAIVVITVFASTSLSAIVEGRWIWAGNLIALGLLAFGVATLGSSFVRGRLFITKAR